MTTYQVTAWCVVPHCTMFGVDAVSVEEALEKAKSQAQSEYGEPADGFESCWDEFEIASEDAEEYVLHLEPERLAANAASELLGELRRGLGHSQRVVDSWDRGDLAAVCALSQWLNEARATVKLATEGEPSNS